MEPLKGDDESLDAFYRGRILILQKKNGFRFSLDAPLLADFIRTEAEDELLELGTGCGVVALLLSIKPFRSLTALEIQDSLFDLARRNVRLNHLDERIRVLRADLREYSCARRFDVIFSNPPYHLMRSGQVSTVAEKAVARHELACTLSDVLLRTSACLKPDGRACFILPMRRRDDLRTGLAERGMGMRRERRVIPRPGESPNLFLSECGFGDTEPVVSPPLFLYDEDGRDTAEAEEIFSGRIHAAD